MKKVLVSICIVLMGCSSTNIIPMKTTITEKPDGTKITETIADSDFVSNVLTAGLAAGKDVATIVSDLETKKAELKLAKEAAKTTSQKQTIDQAITAIDVAISALKK
jgi:hypothetical protein